MLPPFGRAMNVATTNVTRIRSLRRSSLGGPLAAFLGIVACSSGGGGITDAATGDAGSDGPRIGPVEAGADDARHSSVDAQDVATEVSRDGPAAYASSAVHNGACCTRSSSYDAKCSSLGQPPNAYACFCPGGSGIDPSCMVNLGTELVCCP